MKLKLTKEQVESLHPLAANLERAVKGGEVIGVTATVCRTVLWPIYKDVFGTTPGNVYCNHCIHTACVKLGRLYLEATAEAEKEPTRTTEAPEMAQPTAEETKAPQKAKKAPKKNNTKK